MKSLIIRSSLLFFPFIALWSQEINGPAEIVKIMAESKIQYKINAIESVIEDSVSQYPLNDYKYYQESKDNQLYLQRYELSKKGNELFAKAEEFYGQGDIKHAREYYEKVIKEDKNYSIAMTYIGQTYGHEKKFDDAIKWYKKAIKANPIDYMAHWFLADAYIMKDKKSDALREIAIAHILNRNNPRIMISLNIIARKNDLEYDDWKFVPQYRMYSLNDTVVIETHREWVGYALCKAVWSYEPNYRKMKGVQESLLSSIEENECLANIVLGHKNAYGEKPSVVESINWLIKAVNEERMIYYVFYEIWMRPYPITIYNMPQAFVDKTVDYFLAYHLKKKAK